jgi:hypothetical protein
VAGPWLAPRPAGELALRTELSDFHTQFQRPMARSPVSRRTAMAEDQANVAEAVQVPTSRLRGQPGGASPTRLHARRLRLRHARFWFLRRPAGRGRGGGGHGGGESARLRGGLRAPDYPHGGRPRPPLMAGRLKAYDAPPVRSRDDARTARPGIARTARDRSPSTRPSPSPDGPRPGETALVQWARAPLAFAPIASAVRFHLRPPSKLSYSSRSMKPSS